VLLPHQDLSQLATVQVHHPSLQVSLAPLELPHLVLLHLVLPHLELPLAPLLVNPALSVSPFHLPLPVLLPHLDPVPTLFLSELELLVLSPLLPEALPTL
jgi:hypothetical protein